MSTLQYEFPTIEWVKAPVSLATGLPTGKQPRMRHFGDCKHFYVDADGALIGGPARLASDAEMQLSACSDCRRAANAASHPRAGSRIDAPVDQLPARGPSQPAHSNEVEAPFPINLSIEGTDTTALTKVRREQVYLRQHLFAGRALVPCDLCGRELPPGLLVAAHITPRSLLTDAERFDFRACARLFCVLGCDALFELGYVFVDDCGVVRSNERLAFAAIAPLLRALVGRRLDSAEGGAVARFRRHREIHLSNEASQTVHPHRQGLGST